MNGSTMYSFYSFALKNIRRKPARTWILITAIALLVAVLVFSISFVVKVNQSIRTTSERLGADILVVPTGARGAAEEVLLENQIKSFYMDGSILDRVRKIEDVAAVTEQTYLVTMSTMCCSVPEALVVAFNQETDFIIKPWLTEKLRRPLVKGEAVAGTESSFNIRLGLVDVDSKLFGNTFRIVGTLDKTGTGLDNAVFISKDNMDQVLSSGSTSKVRPGSISVIFVRVRTGADPSRVAARIEDTIIEADAMARKDIGKNIIATLKDVSRIFSMTIAIASFLALFLVWSIFSAIANERAREVGIMRAIGAKESHVVRIFLAEVLAVAGAGGVIGVVVGTAFTMVLGNSFSLLRNLVNDLKAPERVLIGLVSFSIGLLICIAGALGPVNRIKKQEPLVVMKAE